MTSTYITRRRTNETPNKIKNYWVQISGWEIDQTKLGGMHYIDMSYLPLDRVSNRNVQFRKNANNQRTCSGGNGEFLEKLFNYFEYHSTLIIWLQTIRAKEKLCQVPLKGKAFGGKILLNVTHSSINNLLFQRIIQNYVISCEGAHTHRPTRALCQNCTTQRTHCQWCSSTALECRESEWYTKHK